jgi:RNA polymerase sigma factor (sigma-70 family)
MPTVDPLQDFAATGSADAFRQIVGDYVDSVYSQCLRQLHDPSAAEDVTQQVFITLATKARQLPRGVVLAGWLFKTARFCTSTHKRAAARRRAAENKAATMRNETLEVRSSQHDFTSIAEPMLDDALEHLADTDRNALLLRFFQGRSLREVGAHLGVSEDAAKQRVSRAVEKLRIYFTRRGIEAPAPVVAGLLSSAVKPASPRLAHAVADVAMHAAARHGAAAGALHPGVWSISKIAAVFTLAGAVAGGIIVADHGVSAQTPVAQAPAPVAATPAGTIDNAATDVPATQPFAQSSPLGAYQKLVSAMEANDDVAIEECLTSDNKDPGATILGRGYVRGSAAVYRIETAWKEKFGVDMSVSGLNFDDFPGGAFKTLFKATAEWPGGPEVTMDGDVARIRVPVPPEKFVFPGPDRVAAEQRWSGAMLVLTREDGNWKLNTDRTFNFISNVYRMNGNEADALAIGGSISNQIADLLNSVAGKLESGEITTKQQVVMMIQTGCEKIFRDNKVRGSNLMALPVIGG